MHSLKQQTNIRTYSTVPLVTTLAASEEKSPHVPGRGVTSANKSGDELRAGLLIINADDWGRNQAATDRTLDCLVRKTVSSASAMVFMEDSERAAHLAREAGVDAGFHLNLTTPFSAPGCPASLLKHHERVVKYLTRHRLAQTIYHPGLQPSFEYVVSAQLDEYRRLYQEHPRRVDGHHHMHLCANVLYGGLLPAGTIARRNSSFLAGQKGSLNLLYRKMSDRILARNHRLTDFFFSLPPLEPLNRLERVFSLARKFIVEIETHPENTAEYRFLTEGGLLAITGDLSIAPRFTLPRQGQL